jgi:hypothetical protein
LPRWFAGPNDWNKEVDMKNLVYLLFLGACFFAVAGWILDWYSVTSVPSDAGRHRFEIDFDAAKIHSDLQRGQEKFQDNVEKSRQGADSQHLPGPISAGRVRNR